MKQETLEKVSPVQQIINFITENYQKAGEPRELSMSLLKKWIEFKLLDEESKWQQERSYSEEEVLDITKQAYAMGRSNYTIEAFNNWFEQFKKK